MGINSFGKFMKARCTTELNNIRLDLLPSIESLRNVPGSTEVKAYRSNCGIDEIYLVDNGQAVPEMFYSRNRFVWDERHIDCSIGLMFLLPAMLLRRSSL